MRHPAPTDTLLSDLYADAVLPSLSDWSSLDARAVEVVAGSKPWRVALEIPGRDTVYVNSNGKGLLSTEESAFGALRLRFRGPRHFAHSCKAETSWPPIPTGGWNQLFRVGRFSAVTQHLSQLMDAESGASEIRTKLLFGGLLVRALAVLCRGQADARAMLGDFGNVSMAFVIAERPMSWFKSIPSENHFVGFSGAPPGSTSLAIEFESLDIAQAAADGRLDQLAAIGLGQVKISGLTPLGDALDILLDRIDHYLR